MHWRLSLILVLFALAACQTQSHSDAERSTATSGRPVITEENADKLLIIDCLLPGQVRKVGTTMTYLTPRRPIKTSALDCEIRGGEYVAYDRADYRTALQVWLESAKQGNAEAQVNVGEIFEKGLGTEPNYSLAAEWYRKAAEQGNSRGMINIGYLYEKGLGVERDPVAALNWYRRASGLDGDDLQFASTFEAKAEQQVSKLNEENARLRARLETIQRRLRDEQASLDAQERDTLRREAQQVQQNLAQSAAPSIELLDPPLILTRGMPSVPIKPSIKELFIVGKVDAPAGIKKLTINNAARDVDKLNRFQVPVPITGAVTPVTVAAVDQRGQIARINFQLTHKNPVAVPTETQPPPTKPAPLSGPLAIDFGEYHALIIGNDAYAHYPVLKSAVFDAKSVEAVLREQYGFKTTLLLNAKRFQILDALSQLRDKLGPKDNLLIYYAGHGELDVTNERGYWLGVDAEPDKLTRRISSTEISDIINTMTARHVLVIADSCYSGSLTRSSVARRAPDLPDHLRLKWYKVMAASVSRTALTSGGLEPVIDSGGGSHSIFARSLLDALRGNSSVVEAYAIYREVWQKVVQTAARLNIEQTPQYAPIRYAGHQAGEFLFIPKALR